ncbi:MAG: hypothetical protein DMF61_06950 [Blastocatellia bacterium AA13]|nr:MAG: hypothetical protein DMF61_06950 [Blastocatellia bacterium AA13]
MSQSSQSIEQLNRLSPAERRALLKQAVRRTKESPAGAVGPKISPTSFSQQRLWFLDRFMGGSEFYNVANAVRIKGPLNIIALERSVNEIVRRHEALRTSIGLIDGNPVQVIAPSLTIKLPLIDLAGVPIDSLEVTLRKAALEQIGRPFDLSRIPLIRITLLRTGPKEHAAVMTVHHIVADGWSMAVLIRELGALYSGMVDDKPAALPELTAQYSDFAQWQRTRAQSAAIEDQLRYWKGRLADLTPLELPIDRPRPPSLTYRGAARVITLAEDISRSLKAVSQRRGVTLFMTLLAGLQVLFSRSTGQTDVAIGSPIAGRNQPEFEDLIGFFINMLVLRGDLSGGPSFSELLGQAGRTTLEAYQHQDVPFEALVQELQPERDLARQPIFQVSFSFENVPQEELSLGTLAIEPLGFDPGTTRFEIELHAHERAGQITIALLYNIDLFDDATSSRFLRHFQNLLQDAIARPDVSIDDLALFGANERHQMLVEWNDTAAGFASRCLHELFEEQAENSPDAIAIVYDHQRLTYRELNERANQLASQLRDLGAGPESIVGVHMLRSPELVIALMGVLKSGAAYLPLDPEYPPERLKFMLADAGARVILTQTRLTERAPAWPARVIYQDALGAGDRIDRECPRSLAIEDNLAYVIYTSGSTGAPKAAMNTHRAVSNRLFWMQSEYRLTSDDCVLQKTPSSFDVSVWEFFWPLLNSARLVLAQPDGHRDRDYLVDLINREQVTTIHFVPSMLSVMLEGDALSCCGSLKRVFCSGEELPVELHDRFLSCLKAELHNLYGPTEAAVDVTFSQCGRRNPLWRVPIGSPVANTQIQLLDASRHSVAIGVAGELHIGGVQVGRGYLNRPDLTAEKFIPEIFSEAPGERLYKTGDLARYLPDGRIEFLGRTDQQVKIRGHRIELQEIENALKQHPSVREAAVVVQEGEGQKRLVAYLAANSHPDTTELRAFAGERLPEYMIPSAFFFVDALPVTTSGKLDRRALAGIDIGSGCARDYAPPSTPQEKTLCDIWAGVLRLKRVGVHDNFFELGGDSIISIQIIDRANREGLRLTPRQLFQHQTVSELAAAAGLADLVEEEQGPVIGEAPLTPIQKRFFDSLPFNPNHYNQALLLEAKLDPELLNQAISFLIQHHDALRLRFRHEGGRWSQFRGGIPEADSESTLAIVDFSDVAESERSQEIARRADELQQSLDLESGSLIRAAYFRFREDQPDRLLLIIHHLAVDGVSWRILLEDLRSVYDQLLRHEAAALPRKTTSYKRWAEELKSLAASSRLLGELEYWTQESRRDVAPLPLDEPRGDNLVASARAFRFELNEADTETLLTLLPEKYRAQVSDALAAAVASGIRTWTGASNALIDFEGHGREELVENADLSRTVGWFTSVFPVVLSLPDSDEPGELLKSVKEQLRAVPNRGAGYGVLRYLTSEPSVAARLSEVRDAEIILNYLGQFDQTLSGGGIFNMASESPGRTSGLNEQRQHLIDVTGLVINKRLGVSVTYNSTLHHAGTIERLSAAIQSSLARLAEHCRVAPLCFTPSDFSLAGLKQETLDILASRFEIIEDIYAASPLQQGLLFHALYSEANDLYLNQLSYGIEGVLDVAAFKEAWSRATKRHAIWRTAFVWEELEQPLQIVLKIAALNFEELDWRGFAHELQQSNLQSLLDADRRRGFDLAAPPLARLTLVRLSDRAFQFIWTHHHLISDGWSAAIVLKETLTCYEALRQAKEPVLPRPRPYRDYIAWLTKQSLSEAERYWSQALKGFTSPTPAPAASAMGARGADRSNGDNETVSASRLNASELRAFAGRHRLTVNTIVQGAWALLLGIYSDEQDVIFGATTSGRPAGLSGIDSMVGVFINTLPVRVHLPPSISVTDWLGNLQNSQAEQRQYEYSPLIQIQRWSELPPRQPLFETLIVFENYPTDESLGHGSFTVTGIQVREKTHYPLTLTASLGSNLFLQLSFDRDRIDRDAGKRLLDHLQGLLENLIAYPESRLGELNLLNEYERRQLLFEWNDTAADYRVECIHQLFEEQVSRTPDSIALCFNRAMVTFRAVDGRADLIAKRLRALGVSHGDRVAVSLQRSPEMAAALLSVMKAGAAYVPADPSYPEERLRFILEDAGVRVLLTDSRFEKPASGANVALVPVDQLEESQDDARKHFQETARPGAEDVFSVIYTSGSTGRPKGVLE